MGQSGKRTSTLYAYALLDFCFVVFFAPKFCAKSNNHASSSGQARCPGPKLLHRAAAAGRYASSREEVGAVHAAWDVTTASRVTHVTTAKAKCKPGQRPFLWLDRATPHTAKITKAELDRVWGSDCWAFQAGKMPDANDGDVGAFPFLKRHLKEMGELSFPDEIYAGFKEAWKALTPEVCKNIRARVVRNMRMVRIKKGGNYYDESMTRVELGV